MNTFEKDMAHRATEISELEASVLKARKRLRDLTGKLESAQTDLLSAINQGLQLSLDFAISDDGHDDEVAAAKAAKEEKDKADKKASKSEANQVPVAAGAN